MGLVWMGAGAGMSVARRGADRVVLFLAHLEAGRFGLSPKLARQAWVVVR